MVENYTNNNKLDKYNIFILRKKLLINMIKKLNYFKLILIIWLSINQINIFMKWLSKLSFK